MYYLNYHFLLFKGNSDRESAPGPAPDPSAPSRFFLFVPAAEKEADFYPQVGLLDTGILETPEGPWGVSFQVSLRFLILNETPATPNPCPLYTAKNVGHRLRKEGRGEQRSTHEDHSETAQP
jgi:hypothetical protein